MKVERRKVFETNSSSSHSLSVYCGEGGYKDVYAPMLKNGKIPIIFDRDTEFGWYYDSFSDFYTKLNYLMCLAVQVRYRSYDKVSDILEIPDVKRIIESVKKNVPNCKGLSIVRDNTVLHMSKGQVYLLGGIDHQSYENYSCIEDLFKKYYISLDRYLYDTRVILNTGNDNDDE